MQKITPFLWFDGAAEEAARYYVSIFKNSRIVTVTNLENTGRNRDETVKSVIFELDGQRFHALDGGPQFQFSPAISLYVDCATQAEVDHFWEKLSVGGQVFQCGWLSDKFGVTWQIVPTILGELLNGEDRAHASRAMNAMLGMVKMDVRALEEA